MKMKQNSIWSKAKVTGLLGICAMLILIMIAVLIRFDMERITIYEVEGAQINSDSIDWSLDKFELDERLHLQFHAVQKRPIQTKNVWILLYDQEDETYWKLPTQSANVYVSDINESEFISMGKKNSLKKSLEKYEVCILYENGEETSLIHTGMGMNVEGGYYERS